MYIEINSAIEWTVRLVSICVLIDTFEKLANIREFYGKGLFRWDWTRQFPGFSQRRSIIRGFADLVFGSGVWIPAIVLRGISAAVLLVWAPQNYLGLTGLAILFVVGSLENFRRMPFLPETPNRFILTIIGALVLQRLVPTDLVTVACLWFIALQSCLSYATAGFAKLFKSEWRKGSALFKAFNSTYYLTSPGLARYFERHAMIGKTLTFGTVAIECLFPMVLFAGAPYFLLFLIWGILLHVTNAVLLRLNNYVWPWIATYPAIIYVAQH